ncbi:hypothetical protein GCM10022234_35420 [Aeromicrobium panaciterrae]|uniref:hypothetical protein n=1 Tax=Aeromicrobium panaciterrae TaxID=363861 RepID=UPI0031D86DE6
MSEREAEPVGSVSEEAFKLFRALSSSSAEPKTDQPHVCTATWCPVCQVVGLVRDNPDAVAQVSAAAAAFAKSLRDLVDSAVPSKDDES